MRDEIGKYISSSFIPKERGGFERTEGRFTMILGMVHFTAKIPYFLTLL